jgi:iron complex outermembrane receptor protein
MTTAQQSAVAQKYGFPVVGPDLRLSPAFNTLNFNMLAPDYTSLLPEHYTVVQDRATGSGVLGAYSQNLFDVYGVFLSERFSTLDGRLIGMAGVRWDYVKSDLYSESAAVSNNAVTAARSLANVDSFTYQAGLNYKVAPSTVLYANASTSFIPQTVFNTIDPKTGDPLPNPSVFDNERGVGTEAGVKVSALSGRISFTADVFDVERQNVVASETGTRPTGGTFTYNALNGRIESRGFELDANIRPARDVQVVFGYGRVDAEIKRASNRVTEGLPPAQVPRDNFGAAVAWRQNGGGGPSGWFANVGYRMQSKSRPSDAAGRELIYQPLFEIWDVGFGYRWKAGNVHYRAQANIKNLLDERYVRGAAYPGEPRRWIFGLSAVF